MKRKLIAVLLIGSMLIGGCAGKQSDIDSEDGISIGLGDGSEWSSGDGNRGPIDAERPNDDVFAPGQVPGVVTPGGNGNSGGNKAPTITQDPENPDWLLALDGTKFQTNFSDYATPADYTKARDTYDAKNPPTALSKDNMGKGVKVIETGTLSDKRPYMICEGGDIKFVEFGESAIAITGRYAFYCSGDNTCDIGKHLAATGKSFQYTVATFANDTVEPQAYVDADENVYVVRGFIFNTKAEVNGKLYENIDAYLKAVKESEIDQP